MNHRQYVEQYAASHRHPLNQRIHLVCVPVIFAATVALAWQWSLAPGLNLALLAIVPVLAFYARLGLKSLATGASWLGASVLLCVGAEQLGWPLGWMALLAWTLAWLAQFYGHYLEGEKPSFSDDLVFLLIGPLFVQQELSALARRDST